MLHDLRTLLVEASLQHIYPTLQHTTLSQLTREFEGVTRPAFLLHLKECGMSVLPERQKVANTLAKARREGRLQPTDESTAPTAPVAERCAVPALPSLAVPAAPTPELTRASSSEAAGDADASDASNAAAPPDVPDTAAPPDAPASAVALPRDAPGTAAAPDTPALGTTAPLSGPAAFTPPDATTAQPPHGTPSTATAALDAPSTAAPPDAPSTASPPDTDARLAIFVESVGLRHLSESLKALCLDEWVALLSNGRPALLAALKEHAPTSRLPERQQLANALSRAIKAGSLPPRGVAPPPVRCDACDGAHATECCPHFSKRREDHPDAKTGGKKLLGGNEGPVEVRPERQPTDVHGSCASPHARPRSHPPSPHLPYPLAPLHSAYRRRAQPAAVPTLSVRQELPQARVVRQPGDGSCLFHSLAHGLRDGVSAHALRNQIVRFIEGNADLEVADSPLKDWARHLHPRAPLTTASPASRVPLGGGVGTCVYGPHGSELMDRVGALVTLVHSYTLTLVR